MYPKRWEPCQSVRVRLWLGLSPLTVASAWLLPPRHLIGREAEVPMSGGRRIPIIGDEYVDREFGTGALKITPGGAS